MCSTVAPRSAVACRISGGAEASSAINKARRRNSSQGSAISWTSRKSWAVSVMGIPLRYTDPRATPVARIRYAGARMRAGRTELCRIFPAIAMRWAGREYEGWGQGNPSSPFGRSIRLAKARGADDGAGFPRPSPQHSCSVGQFVRRRKWGSRKTVRLQTMQISQSLFCQ